MEGSGGAQPQHGNDLLIPIWLFPGSKEKGNIVLYVPFKGSDQEVGIVLASALLSYIVAFHHPIPIRTIVLRAHEKETREWST